MALVYIRRLFPFILILVFFVGCKEKQIVQDTFDKAEAFMETHSDSAYTLLRTIETENLRTQGGRARYALLYTQAQDKNYIDDTNDSLISIAVDYYRYHGDVRHRFLSIYYKGRVLYNVGDYLKAMVAYTEAEGLAPDLHDDYYAGLLYTQLGDIYREYYDFPKSLEAYQKAEEYYINAEKDFHRLYASYDQSVIYLNMGEYHRCDSVLQLLLQKTVNHGMREQILKNKLQLCVRQKLTDEAESIYKELIASYDVKRYGSHFMTSIAEIYLAKGDLIQAREHTNKAWQVSKSVKDTIDCYITSSLISGAENNYATALLEYESGMALQNELVRKTLQHPILTMQRDYLEQELELQKYHLKEVLLFRRIYMILTFIIFIGVIILFYRMFKKKKREYARRLLAYDELRHSLLHNNSEMAGLVHKLFEKHFKMIDRLGGTYYDSFDTKQLDKRISREVRRLIDDYVEGNTYQELERIVDSCNENVMSLLREEIRLNDEKDYRLICYNLVGLSANTISVFVQTSPNNVYQKRSRLKKHIKESDALHRDLFLRILFKSA